MYYTIDENAARRAKEMNSFFEYKEGSATAGYKADVDEVIQLGERQKKRVDAEYHEKIDYYVDLYARKMAENINNGNRIDARVPSIMIAGGSNFPVRKKAKQNAARDRNMEEWQKIQGIRDKIKSIGTGGIRSDDANAIEKLEKKLKKLRDSQERMKAANKAIRMKNEENGNKKLAEMGYTEQEIKELREPDFIGRIGYPAYMLQNNNANIHRIEKRIEELKAQRESEPADKTYDGFTLVENTDITRIQFLFDDKPEEETRNILKSNGFKWSPKNKAWQRMLNQNGKYAAQRVLKELGYENI